MALMVLETEHHRKMYVFGEVGLCGWDLDQYQGGQESLNEAFKHGFKRAIVLKVNMPKGIPEILDPRGQKLSEGN